MTLLRSRFWTFGLGTPVKKTLVSSHWVTGVSETEGLQNTKINPLHQKHKKCLTIPHSCSFALFASLLPALFLLFSTSPCLPSPPSPAPPSSFLLRSKKNRHLGAFWKHLTPMKFKRQTSPTLVSAFFSGIWRGEGRTLEQQRMWCCENLLFHHKSPHKSPWKKKAPCCIVKKDPCIAITFTILGRTTPSDNHSYCGEKVIKESSEAKMKSH